MIFYKNSCRKELKQTNVSRFFCVGAEVRPSHSKDKNGLRIHKNKTTRIGGKCLNSRKEMAQQLANITWQETS